MIKTIQSQTTDNGNDLYGLLGDITYVIPVDDGGPYEASHLQGFARSLMDNAGIIRLINTLLSDIWELTPEGQEIRLPRRMCGQASVIWRGQSPRALKSMVTPPVSPFLVLFLGREHNIETYAAISTTSSPEASILIGCDVFNTELCHDLPDYISKRAILAVEP